MKKNFSLASCLCAGLLLAGCASTAVDNRNQVNVGKIAEPAQIWVYDFAASDSDIPSNSALAGQAISSPQTSEQVAIGRKIGAEIALQLVTNIQAMGMPASKASSATRPQVNDLVIHGYLLSVSQGNSEQRVAIGFGKGESELKVAAEGFQVTSGGLRKLGSATLDATGSKTPGASLGVVGLLATHNPAGLIISSGMKAYGEKTGSSGVDGRAKQAAEEISEALKKRFQEQGWIN